MGYDNFIYNLSKSHDSNVMELIQLGLQKNVQNWCKENKCTGRDTNYDVEEQPSLKLLNIL
jgi:hypothetical protein